MIFLSIFSFLAGAVLAQRFKVMILLPVTVIVLMAAAVIGLTQSYATGWTILVAAAASASMQAGYLFGLGLRYVLEAPGPSAERSQSLRTRTPTRQTAPTTPLT